MPHLQLDVNRPLTDAQRRTLADAVRTEFARIMSTGTDHIAVSIREHPTYALDLGRVCDHAAGVALVNADLREGRSLRQRRELAVTFVAILERLLSIPPSHVYITFTEHKGEDFHLNERYLAGWTPSEEQDPPV